MERPKGSPGKGSSRARGDSRPGSSDSPGRPLEETRRKRPPAQRYTGWNDRIERAYCTRAGHRLPSTFPVASHSGAAVIPPTVVARRPDAMLLCIFDHLGAHVWPDGELVEESSFEEAALDRNQ
jgi:hypothetical protein